MAWEQLSVNKPHLVYIILGGFTSLFMLCSTVIKEKMYIGEATVATLCGIIFGPHAAGLIDPATWGNVDQITLEFSRIVLVVQCFAVGVELPKYYMEKHWRSVVFLLVPVMTFGWMITSLFIWAVFHKQLNWLDSLVCAACVTATDPVLASSVVGKGKFAKRVPRHLRDLLSAESGCNDGMAFPFLYLGVYLVRYRHESAALVAQHWICNTILYECIAGAIYGVLIGYIARRGIRYAHEANLIDRESFLVFYFVLALFCAGSGSLLGMDDLLIGFACGVGFSNDGWFLEKTEESHVSNVIDLLINLAFFVYFGTIIPWATYSSAVIGTSPWKLVVIAILVLLFRRIPIMLVLKPAIPDVKTWREALFAGHFGPMGVGALFVAILARAELETETTTPLAELPPPGFEHRNIIELIWPITTFLVITSILIHGSSIAVFTLGKHINTLTLTMSFTKEKDEPSNWMDRLPRIASRSKTQSQMSSDLEEKIPAYPEEGLPKGFLRRQKEEDTPSRPTSRRSRRRQDVNKAGGHVEQSAIGPIHKQRSPESPVSSQEADSEETAVSSPNNEEEEGKHPGSRHGKPQEEVYQEGDDTIIEDEEGNVLEVMKSPSDEPECERNDRIGHEVERLMSSEDIHDGVSRKHDIDPGEDLKREVSNIGQSLKNMVSPSNSATKSEDNTSKQAEAEPEGKVPPKRGMLSRMGTFGEKWHHSQREKAAEKPPSRKQGPAHAFKIGNTIIVEDEDGEVIKKYDIPSASERKASYVDPARTRQRMARMGSALGIAGKPRDEAGPSTEVIDGSKKSKNVRTSKADNDDDDQIRFTVQGDTRRMSKADFLRELQSLNPKKRAELAERSDAPEELKEEARDDAAEHLRNKRRASEQEGANAQPRSEMIGKSAQLHRLGSKTDRPAGTEGTLVEEDEDIPIHNVADDVKKHSTAGMTAAERRRRAHSQLVDSDSDDDGTERVPPSKQKMTRSRRSPSPLGADSSDEEHETAAERRRREAALSTADDEQQETAAERRRREAALAQTASDADSDEDEGAPREPPPGATPGPSEAETVPPPKSRGIRFAGEPSKEDAGKTKTHSWGTVRWGGERGR